MKLCSTCGLIHPLENFHKNHRNKDGKSNKCKLCTSNYDKEYERTHKEEKKLYRNNNVDKIRQTKRIWEEKNREKINKRMNEKYHKNNQYRLAHILRVRTSEFFRKGTKKPLSAIKELGCDLEFLENYLESQFLPGMTWENHGNKRGTWSIDHIIALSTVDLTDLKQFRKVSHYTNLRPMWHVDNIQEYHTIQKVTENEI